MRREWRCVLAFHHRVPTIANSANSANIITHQHLLAITTIWVVLKRFLHIAHRRRQRPCLGRLTTGSRSVRRGVPNLIRIHHRYRINPRIIPVKPFPRSTAPRVIPVHIRPRMVVPVTQQRRRRHNRFFTTPRTNQTQTIVPPIGTPLRRVVRSRQLTGHTFAVPLSVRAPTLVELLQTVLLLDERGCTG